MSKTLMRGLRLLESIDVHGPIAVTALARLSGIDTSIVSREITALERDGWVVRNDARVELGPRAALLAHSSSAARAVRQAEPLVHAVAGVTGLLTQAYGLVGSRAVVFAAAGGRGPDTPVGLGTSVPLFATAAGKTIAAQLDSAELGRRLPSEPYPDPAAELARLVGFPPIGDAQPSEAGGERASAASVAVDRAGLDAQLDALRRDGVAVDSGELHPQMGCIAMAWPRPGVPAALACMGAPADLASVDLVVRTALAAATRSGARPEDIVARTATVIRPRPPARRRGSGAKAAR